MYESEIVYNTNTCSIHSSQKEIDFKFRKEKYLLKFEDNRIENDHGFILKNIENNPIDEYLLRCLMIYFGEDIINNKTIDTFYSFTRGTFSISKENFTDVLQKLEKFPY